MRPRGKFIFVDDDEKEHERFRRAVGKLCDNEVICSDNGEDALEIIKNHKDNIFMIISDINMPRVNGLELKRMIESTPELKIKSIPFVFYSIHDIGIVIKEAYMLGIQGFIRKSDSRDTIHNLDILVEFWSTTVHPNSID